MLDEKCIGDVHVVSSPAHGRCVPVTWDSGLGEVVVGPLCGDGETTEMAGFDTGFGGPQQTTVWLNATAPQ